MGGCRVTTRSIAAATLLVTAALAGSGAAIAAGPSGATASIYTCTDASGKRITRDRPIPECSDREQRELNGDGSVRRVVPATATPDERAAIEARERDEAAKRVAARDEILRDRNMLARFPNEAAHQKARASALADARKSLDASQARIAALAKERKPLVDEAEFYAGRQMPVKLKNQIDANDTAADALHTLLQNQQAEIVRINERYDAELDRLKKLWSGARPGSLGSLPATDGNAPAAVASASAATRK